MNTKTRPILNNSVTYASNTQPKVGDKVVPVDDNEVYIVESVLGGRLGNKVGARKVGDTAMLSFRELYYYCWCPQTPAPNGFTLIELMVGIAAVILVLVLIPLGIIAYHFIAKLW